MRTILNAYPSMGGIALDKPAVPSLDEFSPDIQKFVYELLANAVLRAIKNGTILNEPVLGEDERDGKV